MPFRVLASREQQARLLLLAWACEWELILHFDGATEVMGQEATGGGSQAATATGGGAHRRTDGN